MLLGVVHLLDITGDLLDLVGGERCSKEGEQAYSQVLGSTHVPCYFYHILDTNLESLSPSHPFTMGSDY